MSTIDFKFPYDLHNVYAMNLLVGTVKSIDTENNTAAVTINSIDYNDVDIQYNPHPWIGDNISDSIGACFFRINDNVVVMNVGGNNEYTHSDLKIIGIINRPDMYAYTFAVVLYDSDGSTISYEGNKYNFILTFKDGYGNDVTIPFIRSEFKELPVAETDPYKFITAFTPNPSSVWHNFFAIPGALRRYLQQQNGLDVTIQYVPSGVTASFTLDASDFEEYKYIHYFYVNPYYYLCSSDSGTNKIYKHAGFTATIASSISSPGSTIEGLAFDGTNLLSTDRVNIYKHSGFSSTILDSFSSASPSYGYSYGLGWDGTNVLGTGADVAAGKSYIYKYDGFSGVVLDSFRADSYHPLLIGTAYNHGLGWDDNSGDLISSNFSFAKHITGYIICNKIYRHSGFSSTIKDSIYAPGEEVLGDIYGGVAYGVTMFENNLYNAGVKITAYPSYYYYHDQKIYKHSGFSTTITDSFSSPGNWPKGITILS